MERVIMNGNTAAAVGAKLARTQVTAAYPISPQSQIVEVLADFVASGDTPSLTKASSIARPTECVDA